MASSRRPLQGSVSLTIILLMVAHFRLTRAQTEVVVFHLQEELQAGSLVGNVSQASNVTRGLTPSVANSLQYQILSSDGPRISLLFNINTRTGVIFTNAMIDREQMCNLLTTCLVEFDVTIKSTISTNFIKLVSVKVFIDDINDNAPTFPTNEVNITFPENAPLETKIPVSGAFDRDTGLATPIRYSLQDTGVFVLSEERQLDGLSSLKLTLKQPLDRENISFYSLLLLASDGDDPGSHTGTLVVNIEVGDINDNSPTFTQNGFNLTVNDTADAGTTFGQLKAYDADAGVNAQLSFRFSILTESVVQDLFQLNEISGELSVKADLQYQSRRNFQCVVEVWDRGVPPLYSQTILRIQVVNNGNTPPKLELTLADPAYDTRSTRMNENAAVGTFVGSLKVEDLDEGSDGMIECWSTNPHVSLEAFDEKSYGVVVANELDYEDSPQVNISITCSDHGTPRLTTSTNFIIYVLDVNDNAPQFTQSIYNGSVKESIEGGQKVVQVLALDKDGFNNNQVTYSLGEADERLFTMDATTGWVRLNVSVDREHTPMLTVVVFATDSGSPPLTGTATVTVLVEDINDNVPYLNKTDYYISEAVPVGYVFNAEVADDDAGVNAEVVVFVADEDIDVTSPFTILTNGSIEVNKKLNRETQNETRLVVFLRDKGTPALTGSGTLTLHIVAYNDQPPQFLFPSPLNKTAWIGAEAPLGSHVCRVQTADGGLGAPQNVLYNIAEGNADNWFGINSRSGELFVARNLLPLAGSTVQLKISSANTLNPQMLSYGDLEVTVGPSNASLLTRAALGAQDSYVIVAGIISGVTVIIAVVIISVIVHLRTTDLRRMRAAKSKATRPNNVNSRVPIAVSFVPEVKGEKLQKTNTTLTSSMGGKNAAFSASEKGGSAVLKPTALQQTTALTKEALELHSSPPQLLIPEGRKHLGIEDHNSDTSGETTCDSGRGASDEEIVAPLHEAYAGYRPQARVDARYSNAPPRIPPREPLQWTQVGWRVSPPADAHRRVPDDIRHGDILSRASQFRYFPDDRTSPPPPFSASSVPSRRMLASKEPDESLGRQFELTSGRKYPKSSRQTGPGRSSASTASPSPPLQREVVSRTPEGELLPVNRSSSTCLPSGRKVQGKPIKGGEESGHQGRLGWHADGPPPRARPSSSLTSLAPSGDDDDNTTTSGSYSIDFDDIMNVSLEC